MTKENRSQESARQRENRLEQQIGLGQTPCTSDLRFLLIRRAARLDTEDLRIVVQRIRALVAQEQAERQNSQTHNGLQQKKDQNNF